MDQFSSDLAFAGRDATLSCFGHLIYPHPITSISRSGSHSPLMETEEMKRRLDISGNESGDSSTCEQGNGLPDLPSKGSNQRKRKCLTMAQAIDVSSVSPAPRGKDTQIGETKEGKGKRQKVAEGMKERDDSRNKVEESNSGHTSESSPKQTKDNAKPSVATLKQDYIHVRARRGQATDSHSLAERVRREKISERMKFLQDLVPGCSKVTGKAVMLDEIINYVQALQCQVEFLSMKLAAVNPRLDFNTEGGCLAKNMLQPHNSSASKVFASDATAAYYQHQPQKGPMQLGLQCELDGLSLGNPSEVAVRRMRNAQFSCTNGYHGDPVFQTSNVWDDELGSVVQTGLEQNRHTPFASQGYHGLLSTGHMKIEL
eukprot:Gb_33185 [translate_table: standard]